MVRFDHSLPIYREFFHFAYLMIVCRKLVQELLRSLLTRPEV